MNIDAEIENLKQIQTAIAVIMRTFKKQTPEKPGQFEELAIKAGIFKKESEVEER